MELYIHVVKCAVKEYWRLIPRQSVSPTFVVLSRSRKLQLLTGFQLSILIVAHAYLDVGIVCYEYFADITLRMQCHRNSWGTTIAVPSWPTHPRRITTLCHASTGEKDPCIRHGLREPVERDLANRAITTYFHMRHVVHWNSAAEL